MCSWFLKICALHRHTACGRNVFHILSSVPGGGEGGEQHKGTHASLSTACDVLCLEGLHDTMTCFVVHIPHN